MLDLRRRSSCALAIAALAAGLAGCGSDSAPQSSGDGATISPSPALKVAAGCRAISAVATAKPTLASAPAAAPETSKVVQATITTNCGDIGLELDGSRAPKAVASFVGLGRSGFFDHTLCHRLTNQGIFVLQCGDPTGTGQGGPGYNFGPVENAPANGIYPAGTLAMARASQDGNSNGSQFFLVYKNSPIPSDSAGGYTVFGKVTKGMDIVRKVAQGGLAATGEAPATSISLEKVTVQ